MMQFEEMMDRIGSNNEVPERVWKKQIGRAHV